jgi:hypothetical protein
MLQYLYGETEVAAQEIVDAVVPAADEVTKEEIAEAAAEKAENIADAVAEAVEENTGEKMDEETYSDLVMATAQCIYTETMAQLATAQACYAMESLFCDEAVEEYYAEQETYGEKWDKVKGHFSAKKHHYIAGASGAAGAAAGAALGARIAKKKGTSVKKAAIVGALVGGATGTAGGYATTKAGRDLYKAGGRKVASIFKKKEKKA